MSRTPIPAERLPLVLHEDDHLLVVNKPAGISTHAPGPYAGEGIYDWLRHREPRWARLAIVHRLDKETSGVMVFSKTTLANRSLTDQFTRRQVRKHYVLLSAVRPPKSRFAVESDLRRCGEKYASCPPGRGGERAVTRFAVLSTTSDGRVCIEAEPLTGRTHQIRVHAAEQGFPILGDRLYGGPPAGLLCLHARELAFRHPATGEESCFRVPEDFSAERSDMLREALIDPALSDAYRLAHGQSDGMPSGTQVDRLGDYLLATGPAGTTLELRNRFEGWVRKHGLRGVYEKVWQRNVRGAPLQELAPKPSLGQPAPERFTVRENGVQYELSFCEGYSVGLFLDQRDNRRRFLGNHVAAGFPLLPAGAKGTEMLNVFAYTCGFSVCAALAGARTLSLDLSRKYLEWGRRNFALNGLDPAAHDFIYGDAFDWLRRLAKKQRRFDVVVLDPPTFSQSKERGAFRAEKDFGSLVAAALPLLKPQGVLLASTNAATLRPEDFLGMLEAALRGTGRPILQRHYAPQPPDFPVSREEPAYLKTVWLRVG